jgi:hypothetical protein
MELDPGTQRATGWPGSRRRRAKWARRSTALALAALAEGGLLWLTTIQQHASPFPIAETPGLPVWVASPSVLMIRRAALRPREAPRAAGGSAAPAVVATPSVAPIPNAGAPPGPAGPAAPGPAAPSVPAGVASALRGSLFGCANASALGLSEAERVGCRDRLAAGAANAAYRPGIPAAKSEYYAAVLAAEDDYRKHGGHPPVIVCIPGAPKHMLPHAIKIGPCYIEPPQGPLTVDVDVPEMEGQHGAQPPPR